ncbi:orotidine 5'-phosphate decarboxylase [Chloroherpeton thalassium ATCC 35110]|uniref:Orotidine-5'-phosphate decarboxylase n=1 Tax=Chloroherpeton thalassium (strain ATCC 35110 / GB-78) TaxID=517418 RepID=B3QV60_CHLT3|nr:orotidine-5'-phosphate decarboxylase [Chloroherpeton thalassium]ACF13014.1 orotidine 5'-phosphate decarboxylase [Chloroherpeton thalassium ATCC 35110]
MFKSRLNQLIESKNSLLCVGLDADPDKIPSVFHQHDSPVVAFNAAIIEATSELAIAYKPNIAFYESRGIRGFKDLEETLLLIPKTCLTIADGKRGDIGNTSQMYAKAFYEHWNFDASTVAPYMGHDSLLPFFEYQEKLTFVLCLTSNNGSADFEEQRLANGKKLYEAVLEKVLAWNKAGNIGIVVGATKPEQLAEIRQKAPEIVILIPGIGAQGGSLEETIRYGTDKNQESAIVVSGRKIIYPDGKFTSIDEFQRAVNERAKATVLEMRQYLKTNL